VVAPDTIRDKEGATMAKQVFVGKLSCTCYSGEDRCKYYDKCMVTKPDHTGLSPQLRVGIDGGVVKAVCASHVPEAQSGN
jgi:hypothetical protein